MGSLPALGEPVLGFFGQGIPCRPEHAGERGTLVISDDGWVEVNTLNERVSIADPGVQHGPIQLGGFTERGGALVLDVPARYSRLSYGGAKASTFRYRSDHLLLGADPGSMRSARFRSLSALFESAGEWFGVSGFTERPVVESNVVRGVTLELRQGEELALRPGGARTITISPHWKVQRSGDDRHVANSIAVQVRSSRPVALRHLLRPLVSIQDALGLARGDWAAVRSVSAQVHAEAEAAAAVWSRPLMHRQSPKPQGTSQSPPLFDLVTLGGPRGLGRWTRLTDVHWRATAPLTVRTRYGRGLLESDFLTLCTGMEYWAAIHRQGRPKPKREPGVTPPAFVLAQLGPGAAKWIGTPDRWATATWEVYNQIKHDPAAVVDHDLVSALHETGRYLLTAALVLHCSRRKTHACSVFGQPGPRRAAAHFHDVLAA